MLTTENQLQYRQNANGTAAKMLTVTVFGQWDKE